MVNPWVHAPELVTFALGHRGTIWDEEEFQMFMFVVCERFGLGGNYCYAPGKFGIHLYNYDPQWSHGIYEDLLEEPEPEPMTMKQCRNALGRLHNKGFIKLTMKSNRSIIMEAEIIV
jgi:hypothetical protein